MYSVIPRIIPIVQLDGKSLVKTLQFKKPIYVGDPINTVKIFNDKEAHELILLDINASREGRRPNLLFLKEVASEAFMPLTYGGGIKSVDDIREILSLGVEKVSLNTCLYKAPRFIETAAERYGTQSIVASVDYYINFWGRPKIYISSLRKKTTIDLQDYVNKAEDFGAGEILLTAIHKEGTNQGYDTENVVKICQSLSVPIIVNGGASCLEDMKKIISQGASAAGAGSLFTFHGSRNSILINFPNEIKFNKLFNIDVLYKK